jgi:hypothetical protein
VKRVLARWGGRVKTEGFFTILLKEKKGYWDI